MKKHFTGIALFIFVVGISGFVASLFVQIPKPEIFEVQNTVPVYESRTRCSKKYRNNEQFQVKINQAVYDEETGQLYANYSIKRGSFYHGSVPVNLHFFIKKANKIQYVTTEETDLTPILGDGSSESGSDHLSFKSLKNLSSHTNLYVIVEPLIESGASGGTRNIPVFDESKAIAVLVAED